MKALIKTKLLSLFIVTLLAGCASTNLTSTHRNVPVKIDGDYNEWNKTIHYIEDQQFSYGISHYDDKMYICIVRSGKMKMSQLLRNGLIIWIYPENDRAINFGLKIQSPELKPSTIRKMKIKRDQISQEDLIRKLVKRFNDHNEIQIVNTKNEILENFGFINDLNIDFKIAYKNSQLIYELSLPLLKSTTTPYSACAGPGGSVLVEFESLTPKFDPTKEATKINSGAMRGGKSGGRGSGRGRSGGGRSGNKVIRSQAETVPSINHSVEVKF